MVRNKDGSSATLSSSLVLPDPVWNSTKHSGGNQKSILSPASAASLPSSLLPKWIYVCNITSIKIQPVSSSNIHTDSRIPLLPSLAVTLRGAWGWHVNLPTYESFSRTDVRNLNFEVIEFTQIQLQGFGEIDPSRLLAS